jgi:NADH-quinone oxidoreductase subunit E
MVAIGHDTYEDLTVERFEEIVEAFGAGRGGTIKPGTQIDRLTSAAEGGRTTLTEKPGKEREKFVPPLPPETPTAAAPQAAAANAGGEPVKKGRKREVAEESAPGVKGPTGAIKVSEAQAESERQRANVSAKANGRPNKAMREDATGAESPAGKADGGKAPGKSTRPPRARGSSGGTTPQPPANQPVEPNADELSPSRDGGGKPARRRSTKKAE